MASSYTGNSGIQKPGDGDQSGSWGDTINTNMDIIDRSINGVLALTLTGTTTTVATTDGTLTDGMYKVLVLGGSPSGTNTITITPNDADKLYFVVNSSGQTATFTQGSGANVSVLNGDTAVIYCDGAGSGAAVADFTKDLGMSSVNIDGGTIDGTVIGGASAAAGTFTTVTASGEIDGGSLDISGNADIDGTLEADAMTLNGTAITTTATLSTGISNTNVPVFTTGVADDDFLRVAGTSIEGRSASEVLSDIGASATAGSSSIVTTGALDAGSITSGFGTINNGASAITTTGLISGGSLDIDDVVINGSTIGHTDDTDLITVADGIATVAGEVSMTTLDIGGTNVTSTATELNKLDGATVTATEINYLDITTLGTSEASKAVTVDASGDLLVPDSDKFKFGAGSDMQVYHDGTNSYITNATGELKLATESSGIAIAIGHSTSEVTFGDNVTVTGNFDVNGTTTTIDTTNLTVTDPLVKFGQAYTGSAYDEGFIVTRGNGSASNTANKGLIWDESADEFAAIACNTEDGTTAGNVTINSYADLQVGKLTGSSLDISADVDIDGTTNLDVVDIDGAVDMAGTLVVTGVTTHGGNVVSDTDSTDDLGTTSVRWANLFVDGITATDQITATGFTGTLDGILGSGSAAAATVTTLDTSGVVNLNLTTDSSSSTSGALIIDGGVGIAKKLYVGTDFDVSGNAVIDGTALTTGVHTFTATPVFSADVTIEDDLFLDSDGAVIHLGEDNEITLTHSADSGLILGRTSTADDAFSIFTISTGDNDVAAGDKLGQINWSAPNEGAGGDAVAVAASIFVASDGNFAADNNASTMYFSTSTSGAPTEKMKITSAGNVVFPTDGMALEFGAHPADTTLTHVADEGLRFADSDQLQFGTGGDLKIFHDSANTYIRNSTGSLNIEGKSGESSIIAAPDGAVTLYHDNVAKLATQSTGVHLTGGFIGGSGAVASTGSWTGSGGVIFHTTSPSLNLSSYGVAVSHTYRGVFFTNSLWNVYDENNTGVHLVGGATSWTANSDERIKKNITELNGSTAYNHVKAARAVTFNWKQEDHDTKVGKKIGFIAQDWETAYPEVVEESLASPQIAEEIDGIEADTKIKGMQYTETIPVLMAALKEAIAKIEVLETKVAALEA